MEYIILGLLILSDRTIYQLRERINSGLQLMYSSSTGSIQAAIKKLLQLEYINYKEIAENGRYKKQYSITENGRKNFSEWVNAPLENLHIRNPELVKIYFMGFAEPLSRVKSIENYVALLKAQYKVLCDVCQESKNKNIPEEGLEIFKYQLVTAQYGKELLKFNIDWYEKLLADMRSELI